MSEDPIRRRFGEHRFDTFRLETLPGYNDDNHVSIELYTGAVQERSPADVAYYRRQFELFDDIAEHGDSARERLAALATEFHRLG